MYKLHADIVNEVRKANCFDFLRYFFAFFLILSHYLTLSEHDSVWFLAGSLRVKAFFVITGFLVTYSFLRRNCNLKSYAVKRFVRIVPAYLCTIMFCILLGCCISRLALPDFFSSAQTWRYAVANIFMLNWLEPCLPGVFEGNSMQSVNGSLWSMKVESLFYVLVPMIIWLVGKAGKHTVMAAVMAASVLFYNILPVQLQYFTYFFGGMSVLLYFDSFMKFKYLIISVAALNEFILYSGICPALNFTAQSLEPIFFTATLLFVAYNVKSLNFMRRYDNITYGLFLYHFPVIQVFIYFGLPEHHFWLSFLSITFVTAALAYMSWIWIEKPLMNRYK